MDNNTTGLLARLRQEFGQAFRSLSNPNYRTYAAGQLVSLTGTWMQSVALMWLTYRLTDSAAMLGLVGFATYTPVLLLGLVTGMVADRLNRRKILILTQLLEMLLAGMLTGLVITGLIEPWMILALSVVQGTILAFEMPARQALVHDLVGGDDVVNAVGLNSVMWNSSRLLGPAIGGFVLAAAGEGACFGLNTLSFLASIVALMRIHTLKEGAKEEAVQKQQVSIFAGLQMARDNAAIRNVLILTMFTSLFGFQYSVLLPVFVAQVLIMPAWALGAMQATIAAGALTGSMALASRGKLRLLRPAVSIASLAFAVLLVFFAWSEQALVSMALLFFLGLTMSLVWSGTNSLLQLTVPEKLRGRVMSVYSMISIGTMPFGSLLIGSVADLHGAPVAVTACAVMCMAAALFFLFARRKENHVQENN